MMQVSPVAIAKISAAALQEMSQGMQPMHPEDAMNAVINVLEAVSAALQAGAVTIKED